MADYEGHTNHIEMTGRAYVADYQMLGREIWLPAEFESEILNNPTARVAELIHSAAVADEAGDGLNPLTFQHDDWGEIFESFTITYDGGVWKQGIPASYLITPIRIQTSTLPPE